MFLSEPEWQAVLLSLKVSSLAVALSLPFGIFFSWLLVRRTFPGKALLDSILHLPLVLPPVVVGYLLLVAMGRRGFIGSWLYDWFGISFAFSWRGAVLAAGLMIYALVWGDEAASRTFRASILRAVVVCSLGFYCLAKSYSFFTGANHLHSIISPGTPGNILSGGLILPLNVAVGLVVCCTMYSFYMYFRRGEL